MLDTNAFDDLRYQYLSEKELAKIRLSLLNKRDFLLFEILYETGCQVNEIIQLKVSDLLADSNALRLQGRVSRISNLLFNELVSYFGARKANEFIFSTRQSPQMTKKRVRQIIQSRSSEILGKKVNPQIIRYTHIAHALNKGVSMEKVRTHIGLQKLRAKQLKEVFENAKKE